MNIKMKYLWILRLAVLTLLIVIAMRPVMVRPDPGLPTSWAVLLDRSRSMAVKDPVARFDVAKEMAPKILRNFDRYQLFDFSEDVSEVSLDELEKLKPTGRASNLAMGLRKVFQQGNYRGAIILSDGRQVGPGDAVGEAASLGKPLLLVGFGNRSLFKDVAIRSIQSPPFAFKNVETSLSATISVVGYAGQKITVKLKSGRRVLGLQTIRVTENDIESTVTFSWTPRSLGTKVLTVEANQYAGEFTTKNNRKELTLDVGRDRFRVLYICGLPGPEYGFLRHQFKSDPAVELVTFVILRNAQNVVNVPDSELSLIPFPTQAVLINQMASFDLVVFEEFSYQKFGLRPQVVLAIRKKVEDGGSFLIMGGQEMLGAQSPYKIPSVADMIPVQFGDSSVKTIKGPLRFKPLAPNHPILRLEPNADRNLKIWQSLPKIEDITLLPGVKPGATILGVVDYKGKEYPVLTAWKFGKGRVAVLATRTTWRFSMLEGKDNRGSFAYQQFWKNMVLWLTHSDEFKSVRIALENRKVRLGEDQPLRVWVYDEYFQPISDVDVRVQIVKPDGQTKALKFHQETKGVFMSTYKGVSLGQHQAKAWVLRKGKKFGRDSIRFRVVEGFFEEEDLRPDFENLKELARATGGQFVTADNFSVEAFREFNEEISKKVGKKVLLWNSPWLLGALLILVFGEWFIRRRQGLP